MDRCPYRCGCREVVGPTTLSPDISCSSYSLRQPLWVVSWNRQTLTPGSFLGKIPGGQMSLTLISGHSSGFVFLWGLISYQHYITTGVPIPFFTTSLEQNAFPKVTFCPSGNFSTLSTTSIRRHHKVPMMDSSHQKAPVMDIYLSGRSIICTGLLILFLSYIYIATYT